MSTDKKTTSIYAVRTTAGRERTVVNSIWTRVKSKDLQIMAIMAPETLRGYVFIEATGPHIIEEVTSGIKHVKSRVPGGIDLSEIEKYLISKPVIEELNVGDTVEIIGGPFKGMKAKLMRKDQMKQEVTMELLEATFTLPITVHADYVKLIEKAKDEAKTSSEEE